jgi:RHS repeat-associated protein
MATYAFNGAKQWTWSDQHLYGAERLGVIDIPDGVACDDESNTTDGFNTETGYIEADGRPNSHTLHHYHHFTGSRRYEITNHLGNVMVVINDLPIIDASLGFQTADVVSATDYYPFGLEMVGRSYSASEYAFGFNGKINDEEILSNGRWQDYGFRAYRSDIGRFVSMDPLSKDYPELTTYQFASNTPIQAIDLDGREAFFIHGTIVPLWLIPFKVPYFQWNERQVAVSRVMQIYGNSIGLTGFKWSGMNTDRARNKGGRELAAYVMSNRVDNQPITLVGHSHGGNVAIVAANILVAEYHIDPEQINIVALNTPGRPGQELKDSKVHMVDVSAFGDKVQAASHDYLYPDPSRNNFGVKGADSYHMYEFQEMGDQGCDYSHHCQDYDNMIIWTDMLRETDAPQVEFDH